MTSPGKNIGKYKIIAQHGSGQAGTVYRALDTEIGREVAIKVLKAEYIGSQTVRVQAAERFQREIRAIGKLSHPNIIQIFDSGETSQHVPYLVMNFIEGSGLDVLLSPEKSMEPARGLLILEQLASAIDYAHVQDVVHRDIKPSNILIDKNDHAYLLDFSTAILTDTTLTPMGQVVGTPQYMAPEVIKGERAGKAADFYSLAVVAYQVFTGKKPYRESGIAATFTAIVNDSPMSFKELGCVLGSGLERALRRGLAKTPGDRFETAGEFVAAVREGLERSSVEIFGAPSLPSESGSYLLSSPKTRGTGTFKITNSGVHRRPRVGKQKLIRLTTISAAVCAFAAALLFFLVFDLRSSAAVYLRSLLSVGYTQEELNSLNSEELVNVLTPSMPDRTILTGIVELLKRDNRVTAPAILATTRSPSLHVRSEALKAVLVSTALTDEERLAVFSGALGDNDRFLRVFAAFELIKIKGKGAVDLLRKQRALETDAMVARILDKLLSKSTFD